MVDTALQASAYKNAPVIAFPGNNPLERLASGFAAAKACIFKYVESGRTLDYDQALAAEELINSKITQNYDQIKYHLDSGSDLTEALAFVLGAEQSRQYVLAQYAIASAGIGAYLSGNMLSRVESGIITSEDYDSGIDVRMVSFSQIVLLDQKGALGPLLQVEKYAALAAQSSSVKSDIAAGKVDPQRVAFVIGTQSNSLVLADKSAAAGLGTVAAAWAFLTSPVGITIVLIGILVVACFAIWSYVMRDRARATAAVAMEACREAVKYNNKDVIASCTNATSSLNDQGLFQQLLGKEAASQVIRWLAIGVGAYLFIQFLPQITSSLFTTQDVATERLRERALLRAKQRREAAQ